jgi:hypothetical protein
MSIKTNFSEHVGLFTGQVNFPVNLVSRPGRSGLDLNFDIFYSSSVWNDAETWNPDAPTGVLGLGWLSPFDMIFADINGTGTRSDDDFFILAGGNINRLVNTGTAANNARVYKTEAYYTAIPAAAGIQYSGR